MLTDAQNLIVVRTELDDVFFQEFTRSSMPQGFVSASYGIFNQMTADNGYHITAVNKGANYFGLTAETQSISTSTPRTTNKLATEINTYTNSVILSKQFFDDNEHNVWSRDVQDMALKAKLTQDRINFAAYRNAFTTQLTADGVSLINSAHPLIGGGTTSNLISGALTSTTLNNAVTALAEQVDQTGVIVGNAPKYLVVPPALFRTAIQLTGSVLEGDTSTNAINVYRSEMGIIVVTNNQLGAAAGGSDTAWFLQGERHGINRIVRQGLQTDLRDWGMSDNLTYRYQCNFREALETVDYAGIVGSTGL